MLKRRTLTTCSISGLPLGYLPRVRLPNLQAAIPFAQLSWEECTAIVRKACEEKAEEEERKFAFCAIFFQIPEPLLHLHALPRPDFAHPALANMLTPHGLRAFMFAISSIRALPRRFFEPRPGAEFSTCIFAPFSVHSGFHSSTQKLSTFPAHLNGWLRTLQESKLEREAILRKRTLEDARHAVRAAQELWRTPRKQRNEVLSIFDPRRSTHKEIQNYARQLAVLLDVEPNKRWLNLVREPWFFHSYQLEQIMLDVRACAAGEEEFLSSGHRLMYEFIAWLDAGIQRAKAQELQAREISEFVQIEEASPLLAMDVPDAAALLQAKFPAQPAQVAHPLLAKARALLQK